MVVSRGIARQPPSHHQQLTIQHNNTTKPLHRISAYCISISDSKTCVFELRLSLSKFVISSCPHFSRCILACCCNPGEVLLGYSAPSQCAPHPPSANHHTSCIHTSPSPSHFSSEHFTLLPTSTHLCMHSCITRLSSSLPPVSSEHTSHRSRTPRTRAEAHVNTLHC